MTARTRHFLFTAASAPLLAGLLTGALVGCERKSGTASVPPALMAVNASPSEVPAASSLSVRPLATVAAGRATQLAPMPDGSIFVLQSASESGNAGELIRVPNASTTSRAEKSALTAEVVLQSLGIAKETNGKAAEGGSGRFTAIAPCADGRLAFSFAGIVGARPFAAVGTFSPAMNELFVSVDFITLATIDADFATDSARPSLFTAGDDAWLWRATGSQVRLLKVVGLTRARPALSKVEVSLDQVKDVVERSAWEWSPTPTPSAFLLTDTASRWIRKIDDAGAMSHIARFDDQTVKTITPAALDAAGRIVVLGNDRDGVTTCALVQDNETFRAIAREHFVVSGIGSTAELRIDRLYPIPAERNAFAAYEATSGRIVRVELK